MAFTKTLGRTVSRTPVKKASPPVALTKKAVVPAALAKKAVVPAVAQTRDQWAAGINAKRDKAFAAKGMKDPKRAK
jgi:hypothetical protein